MQSSLDFEKLVDSEPTVLNVSKNPLVAPEGFVSFHFSSIDILCLSAPSYSVKEVTHSLANACTPSWLK